MVRRSSVATEAEADAHAQRSELPSVDSSESQARAQVMLVVFSNLFLIEISLGQQTGLDTMQRARVVLSAKCSAGAADARQQQAAALYP